MKTRRNQAELFYDIIVAIESELHTSKSPKKTCIQLRSKLSYDKCKSHIQSMIELGLVNDNPLRVTKKGINFKNDFAEILIYVNKLYSTYFGESKNPLMPSTSSFNPIITDTDLIKEMVFVLTQHIKNKEEQEGEKIGV